MADPAATLTLLRDIHTPPAVPWWPPAVGWWVLIGLLVGAAAWGHWYWRRRRRGMVQQAALQVLARAQEEFRHSGDAVQLAAQISQLLRRVAVAKFPDLKPGGLTGQDWLDFLDLTGGTTQFSQGVGRVLLTGPYQPRREIDAKALVALTKQWLHHAAERAKREQS
jgi:hypothetical protein